MNKFNLTEIFWTGMKYLLWAIYAFALFGTLIFGTGWGIE